MQIKLIKSEYFGKLRQKQNFEDPNKPGLMALQH